MIRLTELASNQGTIAKKYNITADGSVAVTAAPAIYDAVARNVSLEFDELASYLDRLAKSPDKCLLLGVHGEEGEEYNLTTVDNVKSKPGWISRTLEFFNWANSGSVALIYLDFDSDAPDALRQQFLRELDVILRDALIGETQGQRTRICRWLRPSTSASVRINGRAGNGLHVFIPVKKCTNELVKLIHKFCWLTSSDYRNHKISKAGSITSESLIDPAVGSPERVVYSSDALVEGPEEYYEFVDRTCSYQPGGVLDAEIAVGILRDLTADFEKEWALYKRSHENDREVIAAKEAWIDEQVAKNIAMGMSEKDATKSAKSLSNSILLSNVVLRRTTGEEVAVRDILADPDAWINKSKFNDPVKNEEGRNVGMIMGRPESPFLHSFNHGGVKYTLTWTYEDLDAWIDAATDGEIEDWIGIHLSNAELNDLQMEKLVKKTAKKLDLSAVAVRKDVKAKVAAKPAIKTSEVDDSEEFETGCRYGYALEPDCSHGSIMADYIRNTGECKCYGGRLYAWEGGTIWQEHTKSYIIKNLCNNYDHANLCQTYSHYSQIAQMIVVESNQAVLRWNEAPGFPCSDGFYLVADEKVERVEYSKDLFCRFKMGFKPDFSMQTPLFDRIIANVDNPVLFQQLCGLALSGYLNKMQKVFCMFGEGGAGKGTVSDILAAMLPADRLTSVALNQLNDEKYRALIAQSRVNFTSEVKKKRIDITGLKEITGGGLITARSLYKDPFKFYSNCSFIVSMNNFFPLDPIGAETERRFGHSIVRFMKKHGEQIDDLAQMIIDSELPGILAWAIQGVRLYFEHGLEDQMSMEMYSRWIASTDPVSLFLEENVIMAGPRESVVRAELWKKFQTFCSESGYADWKKGDFFAELDKNSKIGPIKKTHGEYRIYRMAWLKNV